MNRRVRPCRAIVVVLLAAAAGACSGAAPAAAAGGDVLAIYTLPEIIDNITKWVVGLAFGIGTLFLTIGGARILTAGGNPTEIEKGKLAIRSALIGYAAAVLAPVLMGIAKSLIGAE